MELLSRRRNIIVAMSLFLLIVLLAGLIILLSREADNSLPQPSSTQKAIPSQETDLNSLKPTGTTTPGLIIYGKVIDQAGAGIAGVQIVRNYSNYPGEVIATTNASGYYESDFYKIPGDEMVGVRGEKTGFIFEPEFYSWRHYYGYERVECNFLAKPP